MLLENLIYGTFPDLPGSQQVVHKTGGITSEIEAELLKFYNSFGDCKNEHFGSSLTVLRLRSGGDEPPVSVTKVSQQGKDFSGRWGALLRHSVVMTQSQYRKLFFDAGMLEALLRSSGTAAELSEVGNLTIEPPAEAESFLSELQAMRFSDFGANLRRLMNGKRLLLYSDINTDHTNAYLRGLIRLLPFSFKCALSWSEFLFNSLDKMDLALCYSGRYEAPTDSSLQFHESGANCYSRYPLHPDFINDYLALLEAALAEQDAERLTELICDLPGEQRA